MSKNKINVISFPDIKQAGRRNPKEAVVIRKASLEASEALKIWAKGKFYYLNTSGCQANVRDSEILDGYFRQLGLTPTADPFNADLVLFNTCAVRENAENKIYGELGRLKSACEKKNKIVGICGCMAQEEKPMKYIRDHFPYVNLVFGTHNIDSIYSLLDACITSEERIFDVLSTQGDMVEGLPSYRSDKVKAFVNIMYGCDNFCTYCIVPYTRGRQRSRSPLEIVREVEQLVKQGYKEVTLLGQNVNAYGFDFKDENKFTFANLLEAVAKTNIPRVRFTTSHPAYFTEDVFKVMASYSNIMPALHLPLQSGSDFMLKKMNRSYDSKKYLALVDLLRKYVPDMMLTTDIIVGFPNESEEDFQATLDVCEKVRYDNAFTFIYSPRDGTPAARFIDHTTKEEKSARFDRLKNLIDKCATENAAKEVGKEVEVLFDTVSKRDSNMISGYSRHNRLVHVKGDSSLIGQIRKVKILESHTYSLIGELLDD
ncbi:MAG: tRNA (N6-isopentenyl adenosine(37)-C2)-methylthiotransferase MiaB [Bacilli bacterium]|nr:tRNA (N6-isopentenyl adenosine(37)-C2)-methylthiotransferase MiaB [Bacilli bacterium]